MSQRQRRIVTIAAALGIITASMSMGTYLGFFPWATLRDLRAHEALHEIELKSLRRSLREIRQALDNLERRVP